ncbi:MAG: hypothetical protein IT340_00545 [Chloroflexi bacterium]|nr:hypothetical protein [Chloroflexota bacterium]
MLLLITLAAVLATVGIGLGVAVLSAAVPSGTLSACLAPWGALTRITASPTAPATCPNGQRKVTWNLAGTTATSRYYTVDKEVVYSFGPGAAEIEGQAVECRDGDVIVGGGYNFSAPGIVVESRPDSDIQWVVSVDTRVYPFAVGGWLYARCADLTP